MYCVIVGEIANAAMLNPDSRKRVAAAIQKAFDRINTDYMGSLMANFGMVKGDGFQGVLLTQYHAPRIVQMIIKAAYSVEKTVLRISVALGALAVTSDDRNMTDGPAFHVAFANLDMLKKRESVHWLNIAFDTGLYAQPLVDSQLALLTALTEGWTERQCEIVWLTEKHDGKQKVVSKKLGIPSSVVSKQLKAANYEAYRQAWVGLKDFLIKADEDAITNKPDTENSYVPFFNMGLYESEDKRNFTEALSHFQRALETAKNQLGEGDPLLIPIYNKLARTSLFIEDYENADSFISKSLKLQEKMPKIRVPYAETLLVKADIGIDKKDFKTAKEFLQKALDTARDILGDSHPFIGEIYGSYAFMHQTRGESNRALEYFEMILAIKKQYINESSPVDYATTLHNIAVCYYYAHRYAEAVSYAEEALVLFEENLRPNHEHIGDAQFLLSQLRNT